MGRGQSPGLGGDKSGPRQKALVGGGRSCWHPWEDPETNRRGLMGRGGPGTPVKGSKEPSASLTVRRALQLGFGGADTAVGSLFPSIWPYRPVA